jgi:hypothetical protein
MASVSFLHLAFTHSFILDLEFHASQNTFRCPSKTNQWIDLQAKCIEIVFENLRKTSQLCRFTKKN